jgi:hypothetical protein
MKVKETRNIPTIKSRVIVCDLCSKNGIGDKWNKWSYRLLAGSWNNNSYDIDRTEISYESGSSFPEGGSSEIISYDICPDCFMEKLIPWLKSQGAEGHVEEIDW